MVGRITVRHRYTPAIGIDASTRSSVRKRRLSSGDLRVARAAGSSPITHAIIPSRRNEPRKEAAPAADTASAGTPSGDTHFGYCALRPLPTFGGQPCANCNGSGVERIEFNLAPSGAGVKWSVFPSGRLRPPRCSKRTMELEMLRKLSYVNGASDVPLLGQTIFQNLRSTAQQFGDHEALVVAHQSYRTTYAELVAQCELVARGLMTRGVRRGDRVGIWSPNRYEWVIVQYATAAIGAILVNINPAYRTSELEYVL